MPDINVRIAEGCAPDQNLGWDTVWDAANGFGDWAVAAPTETGNVGGLQAKAAIETAVILCLFTDALCPPDHPLAGNAGADRRGWWGDGVDVRTDLGEGPLGSLLWLLEQSAIDPVETPRWAEAMAIDALQTLVKQAVCVTVTAAATVDPTRNRLDLAVALYGQNGTLIYAKRFANLWAQVDGFVGQA